MASAALTSGPEMRMSREEFYRWPEAQPSGRFERFDGVVVAMAPERLGHVRTKAMVWLALRTAISAAGVACQAYIGGMAVEVDENDFIPDVVVHCGEPPPPDTTAVPNPVIVAEVLSPSTRGDDIARKLVGYFRVPSIRHYLIFWPDCPRAIHHRRRDDGPGIDTTMLTEGEIVLDPPGIRFPLADVYAE